MRGIGRDYGPWAGLIHQPACSDFRCGRIRVVALGIRAPKPDSCRHRRARPDDRGRHLPAKVRLGPKLRCILLPAPVTAQSLWAAWFSKTELFSAPPPAWEVPQAAERCSLSSRKEWIFGAPLLWPNRGDPQRSLAPRGPPRVKLHKVSISRENANGQGQLALAAITCFDSETGEPRSMSVMAIFRQITQNRLLCE